MIRRHCRSLGRASLCLLLLAGAAVAQNRGAYHDEPLPEGAAFDRIRELIEVVNADDPERVRQLVSEGFTAEFQGMASVDEHVQVFGQIYEQSRGFDLHGIRRYEEETPPSEHVIIVRNRLTQDWEGLLVDLELEPPYRIAGIGLSAARPPSDLPEPGKVTRQELVRELEQYIERLAEGEAFSGTVMVARDGEVVFEGAWGEASKRFHVPNELDTKFNLGSMNKMFTSVAVLQLVQKGKVSLDDALTPYLPEGWLATEDSDRIEVQHLLSHTSGLGSYFNEQYFESSRALFRELLDYAPLIEGSRPEFEPGTQWRYSNTGMFLLGFVIEKASGQNYFDYIREHIYAPAGMKDSDSYDMDKPVENLAIGYSKENGEWENNLYKHVIRGGPAGGGFSTAPDLLRFAAALRAHRLLDERHTELLWSPKPSSPDYGFGFSITGDVGERVVGHGGGFPGISSNLDIFLDNGWTTVVLSNYSTGATPVQRKMRELIERLE